MILILQDETTLLRRLSQTRRQVKFGSEQQFGEVVKAEISRVYQNFGFRKRKVIGLFRPVSEAFPRFPALYDMQRCLALTARALGSRRRILIWYDTSENLHDWGEEKKRERSKAERNLEDGKVYVSAPR